MKHASPHHHTTFNLLITILLGGALLITLLLDESVLFPMSSPRLQADVAASDERNVLETPELGADAEAKRRHFEESVKKAQAADRLVIGDCKGSPEVIKLQNQSTFTIANTDEKDHTLHIDEKHSYEVPAKGAIEVKAEFSNGAGLYGYGCDRAPFSAGLILIEGPLGQ